MNSSIREIVENIKNSQNFIGSVLYDEPMKNHTTFKVGGNASAFLIPDNIYTMEKFLKECKKNNVPYFILGGGSNIVVNDNGIDCAVISMERLNNILIDFGNTTPDKDGSITVGLGVDAGTTIAEICKFCEDNAITGFENFNGLPGTIGGACYMNARCYEKDISSFIKSVTYINLNDPYADFKSLAYRADDWDYKKSPFQNKKECIIETVWLKGLKALDPQAIIPVTKESDIKKDFPETELINIVKTNNEHYINDRIQKGHFKAPSAGSVFKNNHAFGKPSGVLIDEAGLKGTVIGGAQIAPWHGNFIINNGNASAKDIQALVNLAKDKVKQNTGFELENEIIFVN